MALMTSIRNWLRSLGDDADEAIKNPVRDGKYAIEDAKEQEDDFEGEIVKLAAATNLLVGERDEAMRQQSKYDSIAKQAAAKVKAGDESARADVAEAAGFVNQHKMLVERLNKQIDSNRAEEEKMGKLLYNVRASISDAEKNHAILSARMASTQLRQNVAKSKKRLMEGQGLAGLRTLEKAVLAEEAETEAAEKYSTTPGEALEDKYSEYDAQVQDLVAGYMQ